MMRIPFSYIWRSLWARRLSTALTVGGVALVVFVFAGVLMLARGLEAALVETGAPDNVIVLRRSATSELSSQLDRATADVLEAESGVARGAEGRALLSREVVLVIDLYKKKSNALGNVSIRGVSPRALELRPKVHIVRGRPFQFGTHEVVVGKSIATQFKGVALGAERSEEHTSELQSPCNLVCRLLLEKKKKKYVSEKLRQYSQVRMSATYVSD